MALEIIIRNEEEAWEWLSRALNDDPGLDEPINLKFEGWPKLDLHFTGHDFDQSVPTRIMPPLIDAQKEIHRLFSQVAFGTQNLRKITSEDRDRLELVVKVEKGSSEYLTNLADTFTEIATSAVNKMESKHILIALLSGAVLWGSNIGWKSWLDAKAKEKEIESRVQMSELEKQKLELLTKAFTKQPETKEISKGIDEFRNHSLHKLKPKDSFSVPKSDIEIDGDYATEITHKPRQQSIEKRIDGVFIIQSVESGNISGYKLKVKRVVDNKVITVNIAEESLTHDQREILKNKEWSKGQFVMEINAKVLRGQITSASMVSVSEIPTDTKDDSQSK